MSEPASDISAAVTKLFGALEVADRKTASAELSASCVSVSDLKAAVALLGAALADDKNKVACEGALVALAEIAVLGRHVEPLLLPVLAKVLDLCADKNPAVAAAAVAASKAIVLDSNPAAVRLFIPVLLAADNLQAKWQGRVAALDLITALASNPKVMPHVALCLPDIVPATSPSLNESREQVKIAANKAMNAAFMCVGNRDIEKVIPDLISCIARPNEVPDCIHKLGATTFVQQVESPTLAILSPLLTRGLAERQTAIKRKSAVIIDNMSKLVDNPMDAAVFLPRLLPGLRKVADEVADPECRHVARKAVETLVAVGADTEAAEAALALKVDPKMTLSFLVEIMKVKNVTYPEDSTVVLEHIAALGSFLITGKNFIPDSWDSICIPYMTKFCDKEAATNVACAFLDRCYMDVQAKTKQFVEEDDGVDLCDCEFSLAYGGKILLNNTRMRLKRGRRYGLCGHNGCGKSTLMRAIDNGQVDGFPSKEELRTVFVEHDIDGSNSELCSIDFVHQDKMLTDIKHLTREEVTESLRSVGFTDELLNKHVSSLSGGWKMKLALARSMLMEPDIMLLDEPTNHLDVTNVAWLEHYLNTLVDVTCMIVSHDSGFLDNVCTNILHYEVRKLRSYKGNLSKFVEKVPSAKAYYTLEDSFQKFKFPEPGFLEGIKTKDRAILKMSGAGYKYPNTDRFVVQNVKLACTLSSRVACLGANGAGKSTLIKMLTGEVEPQEGEVWKHPNLRVAYVAQHAFHHLEQHLDKSPNQYIQWRYAIGEDREALEKDTRVISEEEQKLMQAKILHDGVKKVIEKILGRRKLKKSYEYEIQWVGMGQDQNSWFPRDELEIMGFSKLVNDVDAKEAARAGMISRPLTAANIQKHLEDVGLEAEFATHSHVRGLSGGQKVKVVIAAAMWNNPHMLVLDEPTNYLDRESLGALAGAIKDFGGGVIMITHHTEFSSALCPESWVVEGGKVACKGDVSWLRETAEKAKLEFKVEAEVLDQYGNIIKVKGPKKKLSNKEKKAYVKMKQARRDRGEEVSDSEEEV